MVLLFATMLMHQAGKKIKERGDFIFFQSRDEGLEESWFGESLQKCRQGKFIGFPVQAKADACCLQ